MISNTFADLRAQRPTFEVASVKPDTMGAGPTGGSVQPGGRVSLLNISLRMLIRNAYQLQERQLEGPSWMDSERYDIVAKAQGELPPPRPGVSSPVPLMMQSLLAERFKLVVHQEQRDIPAFVLERTSSGGPLGPKLKRASADCTALAVERQRNDEPPPSFNTDGRSPCGFRSTGTRASGGEMVAGGFPLSQLTTVLSQMFQQAVVDQTGLTGSFDWTLQWVADPTPPTANDATGGLGADPGGASIVTALRDQLGLKLRWTRTSLPILVVDHVERPTPD